jgi:hypothetical protein
MDEPLILLATITITYGTITIAAVLTCCVLYEINLISPI